MREYNVDLHFHGPWAGGVSKNMLLPVIAEQARLKGLDVVSTADITHGKWLEHVKAELVEEENGVYAHKEFGTRFIVGTEVCCNRRVHHLIYLPDLSTAETLRLKLLGKGNLDCGICGRPSLRLSPEELAGMVLDLGGLIGPAHAYTPYFSVYAHFDSIRAAYGQHGKDILFQELGLSADSYFADLIDENHQYAFLTCSDAHSPWPHRIGREFTRMKMEKPCFKDLHKALADREEGLITLNAGLDPREGKYHLTACNLCYKKYSIEAAQKFNWHCPCGGAVKKGVRDRIQELATFAEEVHPRHRPPYLHLLPLAEIIQSAVGAENPMTQKVQEPWLRFIERFGNEIKVLVDVPIVELQEVDEGIAAKIEAFRAGRVLYIPGGGGQYGKPIVCTTEEDFERKKTELKDALEGKGDMDRQKTLLDY